MMSTTAPQPATTPIPVQLSAQEFEAFILPHLSMPQCGPKCKLGYHRVFNLILWVLYRGASSNRAASSVQVFSLVNRPVPAPLSVSHTVGARALGETPHVLLVCLIVMFRIDSPV